MADITSVSSCVDTNATLGGETTTSLALTLSLSQIRQLAEHSH